MRVPVLRAHCESINITFKRAVTLDEVYAALEAGAPPRASSSRLPRAFLAPFSRLLAPPAACRVPVCAG